MKNEYKGPERREENFCTAHSGVCVRIEHLEEDMSETRKILNTMRNLLIASLTGIIINLALIVIKYVILK